MGSEQSLKGRSHAESFEKRRPSIPHFRVRKQVSGECQPARPISPGVSPWPQSRSRLCWLVLHHGLTRHIAKSIRESLEALGDYDDSNAHRVCRSCMNDGKGSVEAAIRSVSGCRMEPAQTSMYSRCIKN